IPGPLDLIFRLIGALLQRNSNGRSGSTAAVSGRPGERQLLALGCSASGAQLLPDVGVKLRYPAVAESLARDPKPTYARTRVSVALTRQKGRSPRLWLDDASPDRGLRQAVLSIRAHRQFRVRYARAAVTAAGRRAWTLRHGSTVSGCSSTS